jgi:hypothetical protein
VATALILAAVLVGNGVLLFVGVRPALWLLALVDLGPMVAVLLGNVATFTGYYGTWRIVRGLDEYDVKQDAKNQLLQVPGMVQDLPATLRRRLGCMHAASVTLLVTSLAVTGLTLAPPPLRVLGAGLGPTPTATATATATPTPTPTATTPPSPSLVVGPISTSEQCDPNGNLPPVVVTLDNSGSSVPAGWSVSITDVVPQVGSVPAGTLWATAYPASGTVPAGATGSFLLAPANQLCFAVPSSGQTFTAIVQPTSTGTPSTTITDAVASYLANGTPPAGPFLQIIEGRSIQQSCSATPRLAYRVTLENQQYQVDVPWSLSYVETDGLGVPWASANPSSGIVPANQTLTFTMVVDATACQIAGPTTYAAVVSYGSGGTTAIAITDTLSP